MLLSVKTLLSNHYKPCVVTYFEEGIFDTYPFLKAVYDSPDYRNANVKSIYMFSERHHFKTEDASFHLVKHGMLLLPLFLPINCLNYADEQALADVVLTMYSPMLVGLWTQAMDYANAQNQPLTLLTTTDLRNEPPITIHVQQDCAALKELRNRIKTRLLNIVDKNNARIFNQMNNETAIGVERTGKSTTMAMSL